MLVVVMMMPTVTVAMIVRLSAVLIMTRMSRMTKSAMMMDGVHGWLNALPQVDVGGNITNYWEDDGETKSRQVGNIRDLQSGSTREMGEAVFFVERGGIPIPSSEYARQNGLPEVHLHPLFPIPRVHFPSSGLPPVFLHLSQVCRILNRLVVTTASDWQGVEAYPPFIEERLLTPEERKNVRVQKVRMRDLPADVAQRLRDRF